MSQHPVSLGFHALSEPIRIQILELLQEGECCVSQMCQALGISQSKLSFHLKTLKGCGLITSRREGRWVYYSLDAAKLNSLGEYLTQY